MLWAGPLLQACLRHGFAGKTVHVHATNQWCNAGNGQGQKGAMGVRGGCAKRLTGEGPERKGLGGNEG